MSSLTLSSRRAGQRRRRGLVLPVLILLGWELSSHAGWVNPQFLPPLETVAATAWRELLNGDLLRHLAASLLRDLAGFGIGTASGIAFGTLLGMSRTADRLVGPTFGAARQIAILAWIPIISIWFGFAESAKIVFIALASFIPAAMNTMEGMRSTPEQMIEVGRALRFSRLQFARRVFLPSAAPSIMTGVHLALIYSWLATVAAEYFMTVGPGIGSMIIAGREKFDMDLVMVGVVILGTVGYVMNLAAARIEAYALRWRDPR